MNKVKALNREYKKILRLFQCDYYRGVEELFAKTLSEKDSIRLFFINENMAFTDGRNIIVDPAMDNLFADSRALVDTEKYMNLPAAFSSDPWNALCMITRVQSIHECLHILYTDFPCAAVRDERCDTKAKLKTMCLISNIIEDAYIEAAGCSVFDNLELFLKFGRISRLFANSPSEGTIIRAFQIHKKGHEQDKVYETGQGNETGKRKHMQHEQGTGLEIGHETWHETGHKTRHETVHEMEHKMEHETWYETGYETGHEIGQGTEKETEQGTGQKTGIIPLVLYLDYMAEFLLYPMIKQGEPPGDIAWYVEQTRQLFLDGSAAPSPAERYEYCGRIFDIILPLIPGDEALIDTGRLDRYLGGLKTHSPDAVTIGKVGNKGKTQKVDVRLFTDLSHKPREGQDYKEQVLVLLSGFAKHKLAVIKIIDDEGRKVVIFGNNYDCAVLHKDIKINETKPKINLNLKKAYQNIYNRYRININNYNSRFVQLLEARTPMKEEKHLFGAGISSKLLGDPKKRYWYRIIEAMDVPDLAVLLLIDGSGSMFGIRRDSAIISSVILHEVLKKQGISHAIVEHRGYYRYPEIDINILVDFNARKEEKYNIMQIDARGDNRDGLALFWAERYMNQHVHSENKLIIVLSDGVPAHAADEYFPPVSVKDTANAVKKIMKRGTNIIAIALDDPDSFDCYDNLKEIYPNIISCNDLSRLTGQLLAVVSKQLQH
ncbi:MAG: hypothetical protein GX754_03770 [Clostridiaceae bacterium]|nr:hypothetical protein [Clostridiaceae bacterium]